MKSIAVRAVAHYGHAHQVRKAVEELTELSLALQHSLDGRGDNDHVLEEMADVKLMMEQLEIIYGSPLEWLAKKVERLEARIAQ